MENNSVQPGQTVTPTSGSVPPASDQPPAQEPPAAPEPQQQESTPPPAAEPPSAQTEAPAPEAPLPEATGNEPAPDDASPQAESDNVDEPNTRSISWTGSEFIAHAKSFGWYAMLGLAAVVGAAFIYLLTRDPVSVAVIIIAAVVLGIYAGHQPRELDYRLDFKGLTIGQKHFTYDQFRSFSVLPEGNFSSIVFMPLRRFAVPTTIYYAPEDEPKIVNLLSDYLPLDEEHGHDAIDRLMHRIRF